LSGHLAALCFREGRILNYKIVLDGCKANIAYQAREINGFIDTCLKDGIHDGGTILFYSTDDKREELLSWVSTATVKLVRVGRFQAEDRLAALQQIENPGDTPLYLFPSGIMGSELAVRWAWRCKGSSLTNARRIENSAGRLVAERAAYAGHVSASFVLRHAPFCISVARGCVENRPVEKKDGIAVTVYDALDLKSGRRVEEMQWLPETHERDLENARFLVVGGRGLESKKRAEKLKAVAEAMGAEFGVSRPVAMNAWMPMDRLVGVSGAITKPEVCIAAGVSGAAAFYAGIQKSKIIVAVNTDGRAPIVKASDLAVIDDYGPVMAALAEIIDSTE
jgi:electron transfer flavoprotein alpha subunit